jgi:hypothetical protein
MKTITIHAHNKSENGTHSRSIQIDGKTKEQIKESADDFFNNVPFERWYYDVECFDDLTQEEEEILEELELTPDF